MAFDAPATTITCVAPIRDAAFVNACANAPDVRPHVAAPEMGVLDLTPAVDDPANVVLALPGGGVMLFVCHEGGRYELHTLALSGCRGAALLAAAADAYRWMFVQTDCLELVTKTAGSNRPAALMARRSGFRPTFTRPSAWYDGADLTFYRLTLDDWRGLDPKLPSEGRAFHERLEAAKREAGSALASHEEDDAHDRAAGLACLMARAGNFGKAAWSYNRWAKLAGYAPIQLVPQSPLIDVGDAVLAFRPELEILQCR